METPNSSGRYNRNVLLWIAASSIAFVVVCVAIGAVLFGPVAARQPADPLMREEVEEELARIPMKETEFFDRLRAKQTYFREYGIGKSVANSPETIERKLRIARLHGRRVQFVSGKVEGDVVATTSVISWDGWSGGPQDVRVTARWDLLVDRDEYIIGYIAN